MTTRTDTIDCRGMACPEPVLRAKAALDAVDEGIVTLWVDSAASRDNVRRFAESQGAASNVEEDGAGGWRVAMVKGFACPSPGAAPETAEPAVGRVAFLVTTDHIGSEPELGRVLMRAFLGALGKATAPPGRMLFLNRGIFLTTEGSEVLDVLRELEAGGVELLSCGTCLEFFERRDRLGVGRVSNMYETVETLTGTLRTVTIS